MLPVGRWGASQALNEPGVMVHLRLRGEPGAPARDGGARPVAVVRIWPGVTDSSETRVVTFMVPTVPTGSALSVTVSL